MDIYAENNGGFQALEGTSPFEEGSQLQGEGYAEMPYQEPAAGPAWYGEAQGAEGLPAGVYQETMMQAGVYDNAQVAAGFPVGQYRETVMQTAGDGNMYGAGNFSTVPYQEQAAEYGAEVYMGEADALPVAPGQMLPQEMEALASAAGQEAVWPQTAERGFTDQETVELGTAEQLAAEPIATDLETAESEVTGQEADSEMADPETADMETAETEITAEAETDATEPQAAEAAPDAGKEDDEETRRIKHETAEAERKAEWEEKQQAKKAVEQEKLDQLANMSDDAAVSAAMKQVGAETEKLTRRNMKDCVAEYIQTLCLEDPGFARMVMHPRKNMIHCFHYINRKAKEFIQQEMEDNDIKPENGVYGSDVPDDLCYQWAEEYFRDPDAEEDREKEEKFEPRHMRERAAPRQRPKRLQRKSPWQKSPQPQSRRIKKRKNQGRRLTARCPFPGRCRSMTLWCRR